MINLAHDIAKKKFGKTFPNPTVGCVIAKNSKIISKAVTNKSGRPHAEEIALAKAGHKAKGASMYVTLEPCFHSSKDGSCTDQILRSGIKEIFISAADPDVRTNYKSIKKLKKNNVIVNVGLEKNRTYNLNKFFFKSVLKKKPFTKVKIDLNSFKNAMGNSKAFNSKTLLLTLPQMVLPLVLYWAVSTFFGHTIGCISVGSIGLLGILFKDLVLNIIIKTYSLLRFI